jgi:hypothetical protein
MSATILQPGDRVIYAKTTNGVTRKLRYVVLEDLGLIADKDRRVPCQRIINRSSNRCNIDAPHNRIKPPRIKWILRSELRKLPAK